MPQCENCGAVVTKQYQRVFEPDEVDGVRVCPQCPDRVREGAEVRDARSNAGRGA